MYIISFNEVHEYHLKMTRFIIYVVYVYTVFLNCIVQFVQSYSFSINRLFKFQNSRRSSKSIYLLLQGTPNSAKYSYVLPTTSTLHTQLPHPNCCAVYVYMLCLCVCVYVYEEDYFGLLLHFAYFHLATSI